MIHSTGLRTVLVHFDSAAGEGRRIGDRRTQGELSEGQAERARWYLEWMAESDRNVYALVPDRLNKFGNGAFDLLPPDHIVRYFDEGDLTLSTPRRRGYAFIINGNQIPIINWSRALAAARRHNADVLVFGPSEALAESGYPESVLVDGSGRVVRFKRHYHDSPAFADRWCGEASFLVVKSEHIKAVAAHVVVRGWGLDHMGALVRRFNVQWSDDPSIVSDAATDTNDLLEVLADEETDPPVADGAGVGDLRFDAQNGYAASDQGRGTNSSVWRVADEGGTTQQSAPPESGGGARSSPFIASTEGAFEPGSSSATIVNTELTFATDDLPDIRTDRVYLFAKRVLDVLASGASLIVLTPFMIVVAAIVKLTSPGPVLFAHVRQGLGGKEFPCLKFRSMRTGADAMQAQLKALNEVDGPQFKISDDPRLTRFGSWIRRWNIDELPQLFNVFVGQMSLVGPRPSPDRENQYCPAWRRARLSTKPGITGLWQVLRLRDESASDFQEWIYYDVEYARYRSFWLDLRILFYTLPAILAPRRVKVFAKRLELAGICAHSPLIESGREAPAKFRGENQARRAVPS